MKALLGKLAVSAIFVISLIAICEAQEKAEPVTENPHSRGISTAPFVFEVFNDYQCPACANFNKTLNALEKKYPGKVRIIYRHFPLQMHDNARAAAEAAEAAGAQGKFAEMTDLLFDGQRSWSTESDPSPRFERYATKLKLNIEKYRADVSSDKIAGRIDSDITRARSLSLTYAPWVQMNDKWIKFSQSDFESLERLISEGK